MINDPVSPTGPPPSFPYFSELTRALPPGVFNLDGWVFKLNNVGGLEWSKTYRGTQPPASASSAYNPLYSVQETSDGGFVAAGVTDLGANPSYGPGNAWDRLRHGGTLTINHSRINCPQGLGGT